VARLELDMGHKSERISFLPLKTSGLCQNVWPGRAVQDELPRSTNVRAAASMYQVS
jgi:hypothetical protein